MRGQVEGDFAAYAEFYGSARAHFIGGPYSQEDTWRLFAADAGHWRLKGFGWWTVTENGTPVGTVGIHHPPHQADPEIGWTLYDGATGRGLAREAAEAALGWAVAQLSLARLVSYIHTGNAASIRLAEALGAMREPVLAAHYPNTAVYSHDLERYAA